jgi:Holliday junction resolvasome RuvABC endonuclease subunit
VTPKVMGVDIGQSAGWAFAPGPRVTAHGVLHMKGKTPWDLVDHARQLATLLDTFKPTHLALEDVRFVSRRDAHASYWRIRTLVELAWAQYSLTPGPLLIDTGSLKKWATGSGKASKSDMCAEATKRTGVQFIAQADGGTKAQEDQADACLVTLWAVSTLDP